MNPRRQKRLVAVIAFVLLLGGAIGAMLYALQQNIDLFYTPSQLIEGMGDDKVKPEIGQRLRIGGMVVKGSVRRAPDSLKVSFDLVDTGPIVTVEYEGILPDLFREGQGIVAQGVLVDATTILASEVLAKHDEEYMPPEVAEAVKGIKHVAPKNYQSYGQPKSAQPEATTPEATTPEVKQPEESKPAGQQP
jgi:cytochrome c-type biogenesis protein CcmE